MSASQDKLLQELVDAQAEMARASEERTHLRARFARTQAKIIEAMLKQGWTFINQGTEALPGPYITVRKEPRPPAWNESLFREFFSVLFPLLQQRGMSPTPEICAQVAMQFTRSKTRYKLKLRQMKRIEDPPTAPELSKIWEAEQLAAKKRRKEEAAG